MNDVDDFLERHGPGILGSLDDDIGAQLQAVCWLIDNAPHVLTPCAGFTSSGDVVKLARKLQSEVLNGDGK